MSNQMLLLAGVLTRYYPELTRRWSKLGVYDADLNQAVKLKQHMTAAGPSSFLLPQYKTLIEIARSAREASRPISAPVDVVTVDDEEHNTVCCKCIIK